MCNCSYGIKSQLYQVTEKREQKRKITSSSVVFLDSVHTLQASQSPRTDILLPVLCVSVSVVFFLCFACGVRVYSCTLIFYYLVLQFVQFFFRVCLIIPYACGIGSVQLVLLLLNALVIPLEGLVLETQGLYFTYCDFDGCLYCIIDKQLFNCDLYLDSSIISQIK